VGALLDQFNKGYNDWNYQAGGQRMSGAGAETPSKDERTIAMLAHILGIFSWFWGPLVIYLVKRDSRFVSFHALQALFLQFVSMVAGFFLMILWFIIIFGMGFAQAGNTSGSKQPPAAFFAGILIFWFVWMVGWVFWLILGIVFGIKANRGEWAEYPVIGRWARRLAAP
jgi:uncharacterized protein